MHRQQARSYLEGVLDSMMYFMNHGILECQGLPDFALGRLGLFDQAALFSQVVCEEASLRHFV